MNPAEHWRPKLHILVAPALPHASAPFPTISKISFLLKKNITHQNSKNGYYEDGKGVHLWRQSLFNGTGIFANLVAYPIHIS